MVLLWKGMGRFSVAIFLVMLAGPTAGRIHPHHSSRSAMERSRHSPAEGRSQAAAGSQACPPPPDLRDAGQRATPQELEKLFGRIQFDLAPWAETGITQQMLERTYCTAFYRSFRLQIIGGKIFVVGEVPGWTEFQRYIKMLILLVHQRYQLPDIDVVITTDDGCPHLPDETTSSCNVWAPILTYDRKQHETHCIPYPDHTFLGWPTVAMPSWEDVRTLMKMHPMKPWSERDDKLFFFGSQTGPRGLLRDDWQVQNASDMNIMIGGWSENRGVNEYVSIPEHCDYRYLLQLPGWAYSARLKYLMLCNSTVIFSYNGYDEFWYHLLEDGVNVALTEGLNETHRGQPLVAKLQQLKEDPWRAEQIAASGYDLVSRILTPDNVFRYFGELLRQYAALQRFKPQKHVDAVPLAKSALGPDGNMGGKWLWGRTCTECEMLDAPHMEHVLGKWR